MGKVNGLIIFSLWLSACSFPSANKETATTKPSDELEFAVDTFNDVSPKEMKVEEEKIVESKIIDSVQPLEQEQIEVKPEEKKIIVTMEEGKEEAKEIAKEEGREEALLAPEEPKFQDYQKEQPSEVAQIPTTQQTGTSAGKEEQYTIQKNDTLMMISFKIYGDYRKWKDLKKWNGNKAKFKMTEGETLKYFAPEKTFIWEPSGLPYMVKTGDTLQKVSVDKYGSTKKWKDIYENNRPLIIDPNLIFAGFRIYYIPIRDIASKRR